MNLVASSWIQPLVCAKSIIISSVTRSSLIMPFLYLL